VSWVVAAFVLMGAVAGCGDDDGAVAAADKATTTTAPAEETATTVGAGAGGPATVALATGDLGEFLVDSSGRTLYLFTPDSAGGSTCVDACAEAWPPLVTDGDPMAGDGTDATLLSTIKRSDGTEQVAYNGHPLYLYAEDRAVGDTTGQGNGSVWYVVNRAGSAIETTTDGTAGY